MMCYKCHFVNHYNLQSSPNSLARILCHSSCILVLNTYFQDYVTMVEFSDEVVAYV
jgi:hypothetical protein